MSAINIELPEPVMQTLTHLAQRENVAIRDFAARALEEAVAAYGDREHLQMRARRADAKRFQAVLDKVRDVEPPEYDKL